MKDRLDLMKLRYLESKDSEIESDSDDENYRFIEILARKMVEQCVYQH